MTASRVVLFIGVIVLACVSVFGYAVDTVSGAHLIAGLAAGCALCFGAGLVA